MKIALI